MAFGTTSSFSRSFRAGERPYVQSGGGGGMVTSGLLFNLDIINYTSGTTWFDSTDHPSVKNFTLVGSPVATGAGTKTGYFTFGSGKYANGPNNAVTSLNAYTKAILFQLNTPATEGHIFSSTVETGTDMVVTASTITAGNSNTAALTYSTTINATKWYYAIVSFDSTLGTQNWKLYINGNQTPVQTANSTTKQSGTSTPQIGAQANSNPFTGKIAAATMWTRALTPAEVAQMFGYVNRGYNF